MPWSLTSLGTEARHPHPPGASRASHGCELFARVQANGRSCGAAPYGSNLGSVTIHWQKVDLELDLCIVFFLLKFAFFKLQRRKHLILFLRLSSLFLTIIYLNLHLGFVDSSKWAFFTFLRNTALLLHIDPNNPNNLETGKVKIKILPHKITYRSSRFFSRAISHRRLIFLTLLRGLVSWSDSDVQRPLFTVNNDLFP